MTPAGSVAALLAHATLTGVGLVAYRRVWRMLREVRARQDAILLMLAWSARGPVH